MQWFSELFPGNVSRSLNVRKVTALPFFFLLGILLVFFVYPVSAGELDELLDKRTSVIWIEGQQLGDMVIGARAQIAFIYIDRKIHDSIKGNTDAPKWLSWHSQHFHEARKNRKALFIGRIKTVKRWNFDLSSIQLGDYVPAEEDIVTRKAFRPDGELPPDTAASFALMVPRKILSGKDELVITCGDYSATWKIVR
jgi:hypothetical protein